ncbi:MAG: hypothetical protein A2511_14970 [Deltaproteobacteria bacterium RIFOXYD12_FULL_50_9]|nr:MAG: hypothetical protein A2511_14970 [Deltaproteobacteria bacterium RIFOXYD12_FULL_50_9]
MKTVAVSQLKATLSQQLAMVKAGEEIIVTEHGRPVARLTSVRGREQSIPSHLLALERAGLARLGSGAIPEEFWTDVRPKDRTGSARTVLQKEREDGR